MFKKESIIKIKKLNEKFSGEWKRDCELVSSTPIGDQLQLFYNKDSDRTNWKISFESYVAIRLVTEEVAYCGYLFQLLEEEGSFYELINSPWHLEILEANVDFVRKTKHFVFYFYDEVIEVIASDFTVKELTDEELSKLKIDPSNLC